MDKPIIGISGSVIIDHDKAFYGSNRSYVNENYVEAVIKNGGVPFIMPVSDNDDVIEAQLAHVQGLILSGGHDVDPTLYNEKPQPALGDIWPKRDHFDELLLKLAEKRGIPVLGICRGAQLINVAHGGSCFQDQSYRDQETQEHVQDIVASQPTHGMRVDKDSKLAAILGKTTFDVNSFHHQILKEIGTGLKPCAYANDDICEGFENASGTVIGVQWHPEMMCSNPDTAFMNNLFRYVIEQAK
ncbi:gamma-glutamyl-gamma-aminobutyrate hydrolase family protein [Convivina intestini]|uniref:gamma-glutamyl-gamma-aminobutyrate hydrolase family protein n=1 Tax=Convivina intestini TaxID=1505726 RepID=UPI00200BE992|nr:gamma-glutamyl-gamma-aminobutyrate hydrolase family protein [Convivina intestini]CAH1853365.1 Putative glutamine amidotransferase [Convivina intestini]